MRFTSALLLFPILAAASPLLHTSSNDGIAPLIATADGATIADSYIIVLKKSLSRSQAEQHHQWAQGVHLESQQTKPDLKKRSLGSWLSGSYEGLKHTYDISGSFLGYSGHFDQNTLDQIRRHPDVEYVEHDSVVQALDVQPASLEGNAPWGLARISHRTALTLGTFSKYLYAGEGGEGVDVYVIDTGTNIQHVDFEGRASWGKTIPSGDPDEDGNGHGTHCSGTIGGKIYGVAKKASIIAIKVLRSNGSGSMSDVVKGVEFAAESHLDRVALAKQGKGKKGFKGSAANMSLGGGKSVTLDAAVNAAVEAGIHFAVAAGNDNADACKYSPAAADKCVTVGASTLADERAYFSNFGKCVDIFAPGLNIKSTWIGSKYATNVISGTSMASPHIAGLLAYYLSLQPSNSSAFAVDSVTPKQLKENVIAAASKNKLSGIPSGTVNLLAWNGAGSSNLSAIFGDHDTADSVSMRQQAQSEKSAMRAEMVRMDQEADRIVHELQKEGEYRIAQAEEKFAEIEDIIDEKMLQILEEVQAVVMA